MSVTCFPYGFPTSYSRPPRGVDRPWPRCINAEPGTFGHECGAVAGFVGTKADGFQAAFCEACRVTGFESRGSHWCNFRVRLMGCQTCRVAIDAPDPA